MTQEQRSQAFRIAARLDYLDDTVRINAVGAWIAPATAPCLAEDYHDSLVFEWDGRMLDDDGFLGCYRLLRRRA